MGPAEDTHVMWRMGWQEWALWAETGLAVAIGKWGSKRSGWCEFRSTWESLQLSCHISITYDCVRFQIFLLPSVGPSESDVDDTSLSLPQYSPPNSTIIRNLATSNHLYFILINSRLIPSTFFVHSNDCWKSLNLNISLWFRKYDANIILTLQVKIKD